MSIRRYNKNQLSKHGKLTPLSLPVRPPEIDDPLVFWTGHATENFLIDLHRFRDGSEEKRISGSWLGSYSGRPNLISQLAPAIQATCTGVSQATAKNMLDSLRRWWRLFDSIESAALESGEPLDKLDDVRDLSEIHYHRARTSGMSRVQFQIFTLKANLALSLLGAPRLHWIAPTPPAANRQLPSEPQLKEWRIALKQEWYKSLLRWEQTELLLSDGYQPKSPEEVFLQKHYLHYTTMQAKYGKAYLSLKEISDGDTEQNFWHKSGQLSSLTMKDGLFPNRWDADAAFHQCLAVTGWNPGTLLSLNVTEEFLFSHPKDNKRFMLNPPAEYSEGEETYELVGKKPRAGDSEQRVFGLWKTKFGAGFIIKTYLARVAPLRDYLQSELTKLKTQYAELSAQDADRSILNKLYKQINELESGCRSVWIYQSRNGVKWLKKRSGAHSPINGKVYSYMPAMHHKLNQQRPPDNQLAALSGADLRDAFALWVWRSTGGNILAVMKALQHRWLKSTLTYLDNNILNAERNHQYRSFSNHLFDELAEGRMDITILAHLCRHGKVTKTMKRRLNQYRTLMKGRYGLACKDPYSPPPSIAPGFKKGDNKLCPTQRCLLCKEHAILLPESLDGISQRAEELLALRSTIPIENWVSSQFPEELERTESALSLFSPEAVFERRKHWGEAIAQGRHIVPGLSNTP